MRSDKKVEILRQFGPTGGRLVINRLQGKTILQIEARAKREGILLKSFGGKSKKVICLETNKIYDSVTQAIKETGFTSIRTCLLGKSARAGGYHWKYIERD